MKKLSRIGKYCLKFYSKQNSYQLISKYSTHNADATESNGHFDSNVHFEKQLHTPVMLNEIIKYLVEDLDFRSNSISNKESYPKKVIFYLLIFFLL